MGESSASAADAGNIPAAEQTSGEGARSRRGTTGSGRKSVSARGKQTAAVPLGGTRGAASAGPAAAGSAPASGVTNRNDLQTQAWISAVRPLVVPSDGDDDSSCAAAPTSSTGAATLGAALVRGYDAASAAAANIAAKLSSAAASAAATATGVGTAVTGSAASPSGGEDMASPRKRPRMKSKDVYQVEKIVDVLRNPADINDVKYLIKWKGWPAKYNTWEPLRHLKNLQAEIEAFESSVAS